MGEATTQKILDLLREEFFLEERELFVRRSRDVWTYMAEGGRLANESGEKVEIYSQNGERVMYWFENTAGEHPRFFSGALLSLEGLSDVVRRRVPKMMSLSGIYLEKLKQQKKREKELLEKLQRKREKLKYIPGGKGALKAQKHFEGYF